MNQPEIEKKILDFWKKDNTFKKSLEKHAPKGGTLSVPNSRAKRGEYVFYDGPPFATGAPHYGHIVASLMKDMVPRYWTMADFKVERKWGWDCHGLPIENIVEKEHNFKHKKDIEEYGIAKFNEDARSKVLKYADEWRAVIERMGRWVDFNNDYKTMDLNFMESVWWVFKQLYDKGLLYEAYRSMHICPRCETTLAQSEVAQGYKNVKDLSVVAKFKVKSDPNDPNNIRMTRILSSPCLAPIYILAWTTTPWTLPGNAALAVGKDIDYVVMVNNQFPKTKQNEIYILSKKIFEKWTEERKIEGEVIKIIKGKDLVGLEYEPLFPYYDNDKLENHENAFKVYPADFVNTDEGTGIVHIAPAFGEYDYNLSKKENLPLIRHVNIDGTFNDEVIDFAGQEVKPKDDPSATDVKIIQYLAKQGLLFSKEKYEHSYPHCWRCDSPLLNYSTSSWFVAVEKIKKDLLKNAKNINWMPSHMKDGRFGQWLEGARDWSISRQRFWGSVIPIWKCSSEKHQTPNIKGMRTHSGYWKHTGT